MMNRNLILSLLCTSAIAATAQNPIIHDQFCADPTARVFDGKVYMYPSHDIPSPIESLKEWFCMEDYHVFSSENLVDWTDHGVIVTQNAVPWVTPDSYAMWAPDCVYKNGLYYFYFPASPKTMERGFTVGVAIAQSPEGPFRPMERPIEGIMGIDPCVLIDDDGSSYIYWSGMGIRGAKLKDNMMELDGESQLMEGLPEGFKEGPFAFKRDGHYYLTFPWVRDVTETLAYCMSDSPLGPWKFKGLIMAESPTGCWTNHHSLVEYQGEWYLFYHHNDYSPNMDKKRSARIDKVTFNADGTICEVTPTLRGVGVAEARRPIHLDRYSEIGGRAEIDFIDTLNRFDGWKTILPKKDAYVRFDRVDFSDVAPQMVKARVKSKAGARLDVYVIDGQGTKTLVANVDVPQADDWVFASTSGLRSAPTGINDLLVTLVNGDAEIDYIGFDILP